MEHKSRAERNEEILIIEDEPEMWRNLVTILRLEKFHPMAAANGRAGLEQARQELPDLILCDVTMPEPLASLGLTPRVAEVLLWVAQGKTNSEMGAILGISESTVKKHVLEIFEQLGVGIRSAAMLRAIEVPSAQGVRKQGQP